MVGSIQAACVVGQLGCARGFIQPPISRGMIRQHKAGILVGRRGGGEVHCKWRAGRVSDWIGHRNGILARRIDCGIQDGEGGSGGRRIIRHGNSIALPLVSQWRCP